MIIFLQEIIEVIHPIILIKVHRFLVTLIEIGKNMDNHFENANVELPIAEASVNQDPGHPQILNEIERLGTNRVVIFDLLHGRRVIDIEFFGNENMGLVFLPEITNSIDNEFLGKGFFFGTFEVLEELTDGDEEVRGRGILLRFPTENYK